jgi:hypothetical protein
MNTTDINLANKYQQKTDKQHILDNPDTYIGSVEEVETDLWILNETGDKIIEKNITLTDLANYTSLKYVNAMMLWEESPEIEIGQLAHS